jgi:hypothetical protein
MALGIGRRQEPEPVLDTAHPEMRLAIVSGPVVDVRDMDESGRRGIAGVKRTLLTFEARDVAGEAIDPFTGLGGCEPDDQFAAAPERRHEIGLETRRAKLGLQLEGGGGTGRKVESKLAGRPRGDPLARRLSGGGGEQKQRKDEWQARQHQAPA